MRKYDACTHLDQISGTCRYSKLHEGKLPQPISPGAPSPIRASAAESTDPTYFCVPHELALGTRDDEGAWQDRVLGFQRALCAEFQLKSP